MFDKHYHHKETVGRVTVHEHKAPTDESVRLLKELTREAEKHVLSKGKLKFNKIEVEWKVWNNWQSGETECVGRFDINGDEHRMTVPLEGYEAKRLYQTSPKQFATLIRDAVIKELATIMTVALFEHEHRTLEIMFSDVLSNS